MSRPCQDGCGHPATFIAKTRRRKVTGRNDHDLCRRCWAKRMEAANVQIREAHLDRRAAVESYWARQAA